VPSRKRSVIISLESWVDSEVAPYGAGIGFIAVCMMRSLSEGESGRLIEEGQIAAAMCT